MLDFPEPPQSTEALRLQSQVEQRGNSLEIKMSARQSSEGRRILVDGEVKVERETLTTDKGMADTMTPKLQEEGSVARKEMCIAGDQNGNEMQAARRVNVHKELPTPSTTKPLVGKIIPGTLCMAAAKPSCSWQVSGLGSLGLVLR